MEIQRRDDERKHMTLCVFAIRSMHSELLVAAFCFDAHYNLNFDVNVSGRREAVICDMNAYDGDRVVFVVAAVCVRRIYLFDFISCAEWLMHFIEYEINSSHVLLNSV